MAYSSALFDRDPARTLPSAQVRKWDRLLELLQPCGKTTCSRSAAAGAASRSTPPSRPAAGSPASRFPRSSTRWAHAEVEQAGLEGQVDIRLQDYRDVPERYTGIASIEMFEAVGEKWWPVFFGRMRDLLAPGGAVALQTITIEEPRFEDYKRNPDFIQRYIFPGGMLPSPERFAAAANAQGLSVSEPTFFGSSYADTLGEWRRRFEAALPAGPRARLRRTLHPHVALLPRVLPSGLLGRHDRRHAGAAGGVERRAIQAFLAGQNRRACILRQSPDPNTSPNTQDSVVLRAASSRPSDRLRLQRSATHEAHRRRSYYLSFDNLGLDPRLLEAVARMGYTEPTPIQREAIPLALAGRDVVGCAQTGTGKTAAFVLPILQRIPAKPGGVRALVVTPTRELAAQIEQVARRSASRPATASPSSTAA